MTMTDPIADMLTRIRNANTAMHDEVAMPSSKLKEALADLLVSEGYLAGFQVADAPDRPGRSCTVVFCRSCTRVGRGNGTVWSPVSESSLWQVKTRHHARGSALGWRC